MSARETPNTAVALKLLDLGERVQRANVEYTEAVTPHVSNALTARDRTAFEVKAALCTAAAGLARLAEMFGQERS